VVAAAVLLCWYSDVPMVRHAAGADNDFAWARCSAGVLATVAGFTCRWRMAFYSCNVPAGRAFWLNLLFFCSQFSWKTFFFCLEEPGLLERFAVACRVLAVMGGLL